MPIDKNSGRPWYSAVIVADSTQGINSLDGLKVAALPLLARHPRPAF